MKYFVISCSEDGHAFVDVYDRDRLLTDLKLKDQTWGPDVSFIPAAGLDGNADPAYWENNILIIKGEIVVPKPIDVVKEYEI